MLGEESSDGNEGGFPAVHLSFLVLILFALFIGLLFCVLTEESFEVLSMASAQR